jgi:hypothetical protein
VVQLDRTSGVGGLNVGHGDLRRGADTTVVRVRRDRGSQRRNGRRRAPGTADGIGQPG